MSGCTDTRHGRISWVRAAIWLDVMHVHMHVSLHMQGGKGVLFSDVQLTKICRMKVESARKR
jgi:hypothetical protein